MAEPLKVSSQIDVRQEVCPMTFVKAKLQLEELETGEKLEILLRDGEPFKNVTRSLKDEGHKILCVDRLDDQSFRLIVEKGEDTP